VNSATAPTNGKAGGVAQTLAELVVPIESLRVYPRNPRRGSTQTIRDSLIEHGQYRPIVVNARTQEILAGNHTYQAAVELGWDEIAVTYVDVDDEQAAQIVLIDNRSNDLAEYDAADLAELLSSLPSLTGTGYTQPDFESLLAQLAIAEPEEPVERARYSFDVFSRDDVIERAALALRESGFPYKQMPVHVAMTEINDLANMSDAQLVRTRAGYAVADSYHPHRYHAHVGSQANAVDVYEDERKLRIAIGHLLTYGLPWTSITSVLSLTHGAQVPSNFRPGFACSIMRRFGAPDAVVLDTSTGYGGRLVGFLASPCASYIGIDPAHDTYEANRRLAADLCPPAKTVELLCEPAEDVASTSLKGRVDLCVTSPPYFSKEHYSDEPTQSWKRYSTSSEWRQGFLVPMIELQYAALKRRGVSIVNIADVVIAGETIPLVDWTLNAAGQVGFEVEDVEQLPLTRRWGPQDDVVHTEPVLVLRKR
jgi:ParB-like chromosome segregation protein Spo0J